MREDGADRVRELTIKEALIGWGKQDLDNLSALLGLDYGAWWDPPPISSPG